EGSEAIGKTTESKTTGPTKDEGLDAAKTEKGGKGQEAHAPATGAKGKAPAGHAAAKGGGGPGAKGGPGGGGKAGAALGGAHTPASSQAGPGSEKGVDLPALSTGGIALIDEELVEHQRWAGARGAVGEAGSLERAAFIADTAGGAALGGL